MCDGDLRRGRACDSRGAAATASREAVQLPGRDIVGRDSRHMYAIAAASGSITSKGPRDAGNARVLLDELVRIISESLVVTKRQQRPELRHVVL